jgi:ABC-type sulfate/molybdate transport systems ATPase subunit
MHAILVTHDAADALATEAEVALLHEGKLAALGPATEVLAAERERLLARLSGSAKAKSPPAPAPSAAQSRSAARRRLQSRP